METKSRWRMQPGEILRQGPGGAGHGPSTGSSRPLPLARALAAGGIPRAGDHAAHPRGGGGDPGHRPRGARRHRRRRPRWTRGEEIDEVAAAGAVFAISPGLTAELLDASKPGPHPADPRHRHGLGADDRPRAGVRPLQVLPGRGRRRREDAPGVCRTFPPRHLLPYGRDSPRPTTGSTSPWPTSPASAARGSRRRGRSTRGTGRGSPRSLGRPVTSSGR